MTAYYDEAGIVIYHGDGSLPIRFKLVRRIKGRLVAEDVPGRVDWMNGGVK